MAMIRWLWSVTGPEINKTGIKGFETELLGELERLKNEEGINTPKVGIYLYGYNTNYQESIDQIFDLEKTWFR